MARKASSKSTGKSSESLKVDVPIPGRYNYEGLERTFHEKARLGIMTSLITHAEGLTFNDLKELCALSDGNLNRHIDVLRESGYVRVDKVGAGRSAKSTCFATPLGAKSFQLYLAELERVIQDAADVAAAAKHLRLGFS